MRWLLLLVSISLASFFLALEVFILLYAINNRHYAYYYIGLAAFALFIVLLEKKFGGDVASLHVSGQIIRKVFIFLTYAGVFFGFVFIALNFWMDRI